MNKKQGIIESAILLFGENGYEKTSIAAICEHAKVSKGAVFHYFKNKDELLRVVFIRMTQIMNEIDDNLNTINECLTPKERLVNLLEQIFLSMTSPEQKLYYQLDFQVLCQSSTRKILNDLIEERYQVMMECFNKILCDISSANNIVDSHMIIAEIDGIALNYLYAKDSYPLEGIKDRYIKKYLLLLDLY